MKRKRKCEVCDRKQGDTTDRTGSPDNDKVPLGAVTKCDVCARWACPDCLHEADCCFSEEFDQVYGEKAGEAPPGWMKKTNSPPGRTEFVRIDE